MPCFDVPFRLEWQGCLRANLPLLGAPRRGRLPCPSLCLSAAGRLEGSGQWWSRQRWSCTDRRVLTRRQRGLLESVPASPWLTQLLPEAMSARQRSVVWSRRSANDLNGRASYGTYETDAALEVGLAIEREICW